MVVALFVTQHSIGQSIKSPECPSVRACVRSSVRASYFLRVNKR